MNILMVVFYDFREYSSCIIDGGHKICYLVPVSKTGFGEKCEFWFELVDMYVLVFFLYKSLILICIFLVD